MMKRKRTLIEMQQLFGDLIVRRAQDTDPAELPLSTDLMDRVHDGADALLTRRGDLREQHRYIRGLAYETRLVLCMWLLDTNLAAKLIHSAYVEGKQVCR